MTVRLVALVGGRVQGVGFRAWVERKATRLGLAGSATNLEDGRVEVVAEGPRSDCDALLGALRATGVSSPPGAVVEVQAEWADAQGLAGFVTR